MTSVLGYFMDRSSFPYDIMPGIEMCVSSSPGHGTWQHGASNGATSRPSQQSDGRPHGHTGHGAGAIPGVGYSPSATGLSSPGVWCPTRPWRLPGVGS